MASSMSNSFALLGADNGFKQVPSKKNRKKKNKAQDHTPADESSVMLSSNPSEMSEDAAGVASESFQQVCSMMLPWAHQTAFIDQSAAKALLGIEGSRAPGLFDSPHHMQVKATAKSKKQQQGIDTDIIKQEDEAASRAHSQDALQNLFTRWEHSMEQARRSPIHAPNGSRLSLNGLLVKLAM